MFLITVLKPGGWSLTKVFIQLISTYGRLLPDANSLALLPVTFTQMLRGPSGTLRQKNECFVSLRLNTFRAQKTVHHRGCGCNMGQCYITKNIV